MRSFSKSSVTFAAMPLLQRLQEQAFTRNNSGVGQKIAN